MNAIVAVDKNWAIGCDGDLLFSLPTDMKRFRTLTTGGTVIMGRKTLESFPGGKPLPKRRNVVITRNREFGRDDVDVVSSIEEALQAVAGTEEEKLWVIGGGSIYTAMLSHCKRVFLTKVDAAAPDADTFFPNLDALPNWEVESVVETVEENGFTYQFINYVNTAL